MLGATEIECDKKGQLVLKIFNLAGYTILYAKSNLIPSTIMPYLGFITNLDLMKYECSLEKQSKYLKSIGDLLETHRSQGFIKAKQLASVLGKLQSLHRSHGSIVRLMLRNAQHELGIVVVVSGWSADVVLTMGLVELEFFLHYLPMFNGTHIPVSRDSICTIEQSEVHNMICNVVMTNNDIPGLMVSDASSKYVYLYYQEEIQTVLDYEFDIGQQQWGSGRRELMAIQIFLEYCVSTKKELKYPTIYWQCDSNNVYYYMTIGSRNLNIQRDILQVKLLELQLGIHVVPIWTSREHARIRMADDGSKEHLSTDNWGISRDSLQEIFVTLQCHPTVDAFANETNNICNKFYSLFPQNSSQGINYFSQMLSSNEIYYICAPTKLIGAAFRKFLNTPDLTAIFTIPLWYSSQYWSLFHDGQTFHNSVKDFCVFSSKCLNFHDKDITNVFSPYHDTQFVALLAKT